MDIARLIFGAQIDSQRTFNDLAFRDLSMGRALCECGATITDWSSDVLPSEGAFPIYDCPECGRQGAQFFCTAQRAHLSERQRLADRPLWKRLLRVDA